MNLTANNKKTVIDPVCGMDVVPTKTEIKTTIDGETYYFCAEGCRKSFIEISESETGQKERLVVPIYGTVGKSHRWQINELPLMGFIYPAGT
jgi:YHS domain-containing protein